MSEVNYKSAIESLLFTWGESLSIAKIANILEIPRSDTKVFMDQLMEEYQNMDRGIKLIEVNQSYQLVTKECNFQFLEKLCKTTKTRGLSKAMTEVLAIITYKQPITKIEIEALRGVKCDKPLTALMDRELIEVKGILEKIGRPKIYGTTEEFLRSFGFKNLKELPDINDFEHVELFNNFTIDIPEDESKDESTETSDDTNKEELENAESKENNENEESTETIEPTENTEEVNNE